MTMRVRELFPTRIAQGRLSGYSALNRELQSEIQTFARHDRMGQQWSKENYLGGYTSYASLSDLHQRSPAFAEFQARLQRHAEAFAKAQSWSMHGMRLRMTECWMNIMPRHTYHTLHLHPHSVISGAYYVTSPKGSVAMKIEDPRMAHYMNAPVREGKGEELYYRVEPTPGTFVMFESWVRHEVPPNRSTQPRISISFNYSLEPDDDLD